MAYITPNDEGIRAGSDWKSIMNAIAAATAEGNQDRVVRIPRYNARTRQELWEIGETILLPSNITILLDDCHMRMMDGVMCNMFRNENAYTEFGLTPEGEQTEIHIIGQGNAVIDGGNHNGLNEANWRRIGWPVRNNNFILLINVSHYSMRNFRCINMRYWAINQMGCSHGHLSHLDFDAGKHYRNQDGINLRVGCHDILIEHITGFTGDDVVALTVGGPRGSEQPFLTKGKSVDVHDVTIRDVRANTRQSIVALRNMDGAKMYRIQIENITDIGAPYAPWGVVRIGENNYFRERPNQLGETYEITVKGVHSRARGTVYLGASLMDSHISDVHAGYGALHAVSTAYVDGGYDQETKCHLKGGVTMKNVVISQVYYNAVPSSPDEKHLIIPGKEYTGCAVDFRCMREGEDTLENVVVRDVFTNGAPKLLIHPDYSLEIN